jgi:hypothetical protein
LIPSKKSRNNFDFTPFKANDMYDLTFDAKQVNKDLKNNIGLQLSLNFQTVQLQVPIEIQGKISASTQNE